MKQIKKGGYKLSDSMVNQNIEKYAETVLRIGLNIQHGQKLIIEAPIQSAPFVRTVTSYAYELGASYVHHEWSDDELTLINHKQAPYTSLGYYPEWKANGLEKYANENAAVLFIQAPNPELLTDVSVERSTRYANERSAIRRPYLEHTHLNKISWVIVNVPSDSWSTKCFPELPVDEGKAKLWDIIFQAARIDSIDPITNWKNHLNSLKKTTEQLNALHIQKLVYLGPSTDLTIELPEKHQWLYGSRMNRRGIPFVSNMPTEEVFTIPKKEGINGIVASTRPLNFNGSIIEDFSLTFKEGKVVQFTAVKGKEVLNSILHTDEGARFLGEVALVPHHSLISNMNLTFYNTLFDENASCHLALGQSFPNNLVGGENMSDQELQLNGANKSLIHIDFMIGSSALNIDAQLADGSTIPLFRHGDWSEKFLAYNQLKSSN